jgi:prepilin-type N-terminal cleavage/methylation domain-containing protein
MDRRRENRRTRVPAGDRADRNAGIRNTWRHMSIRPGRRSSGVTLIEMMVVLAIVGVLAAIAAPNLSEFLSATGSTRRRTNS